MSVTFTPLLVVCGIVAALVIVTAGHTGKPEPMMNADGKVTLPKVAKSDSEWEKALSPDQFDILRHAGTEPPYKNAYFNSHGAGTYFCAACGQKLFLSDSKYDSRTGWPSFWQPSDRYAVLYRKDHDDGMDRIEVLCARCGGHLGHVFDDGPEPTGKRYCMNSGALRFEAQAPKPKKG